MGATNFKCEDVLKAEWCDKIKEVAAAMKIKFETVMKVMKEIIAKGITKAKEIIEEIKKHFFPSGELVIEDAITCEDILSEKVCATLEEAAKKLKVKVEMVDKIVREAVAKGITKAKEIIKLVRQKIIDMATTVKCEDVLSAKVCTELRTIAKTLKIKVEEIDAIIKKLVEEKITDAKRIIEEVKAKLIELAHNFKCTDVLSEKVCTEIKDFAAKIKVEAKKVDEIIKKIVVDGVTKAKEIIKKIIEHFFPKPQ